MTKIIFWLHGLTLTKIRFNCNQYSFRQTDKAILSGQKERNNFVLKFKNSYAIITI